MLIPQEGPIQDLPALTVRPGLVVLNWTDQESTANLVTTVVQDQDWVVDLASAAVKVVQVVDGRLT